MRVMASSFGDVATEAPVAVGAPVSSWPHPVVTGTDAKPTARNQTTRVDTIMEISFG
jgi:hypothetical protein